MEKVNRPPPSQTTGVFWSTKHSLYEEIPRVYAQLPHLFSGSEFILRAGGETLRRPTSILAPIGGLNMSLLEQRDIRCLSLSYEINVS